MGWEDHRQSDTGPRSRQPEQSPTICLAWSFVYLSSCEWKEVMVDTLRGENHGLFHSVDEGKCSGEVLYRT